MSQNNDIYQISGRVKNHLARADIAYSPIGEILINYFSLALLDLYIFSEILPDPFKRDLQIILESKESIPKNIIQAAENRFPPPKILYKQVMELMPQFSSNEAALAHFEKEYKDLTETYGMEGDGFWMEAESVRFPTEDHKAIMRLARGIQMLKYLVNNPKCEFKESDLDDEYDLERYDG